MLEITGYVAPVLITAILLEVGINAYQKAKRYEAKDAWANIALGAGTLPLGLFMKGIAFSVYSLITPYALFDIGFSWWEIAIGFVLSDFTFYWYHRLSHERRIFWAAHVTHHTSKKFNFTTALRAPFHQTHRFLFWTPLALLGFDPWLIVTIEGFCFTYQFFLHTQYISKLGPLEWFMCTPSHHRVHHASNPKYIDKNYGGSLIIWDKMFGTFQVEEERPVYGITKPVTTKNPLRILFHGYYATFYKSCQMSSIKNAFKYLFGRLGSDFSGLQKSKA